MFIILGLICISISFYVLDDEYLTDKKRCNKNHSKIALIITLFAIGLILISFRSFKV